MVETFASIDIHAIDATTIWVVLFVFRRLLVVDGLSVVVLVAFSFFILPKIYATYGATFYRVSTRLDELNVYISDHIFDPLEQQRKELIRVWQEFQRLFVPPGDATSGAAHSPLPSIATLQAAVNDARVGWEAKHESGMGLARNRFLCFMETMDDHSFLFKFVPTEDKYISLLTGVVASVVKVFHHHTCSLKHLLFPVSCLVDANACVRLQ